jgi:hypothetical protein
MSDNTNENVGEDTKPWVANKVIPVMREAIVTVQMILFKTLQDSLRERYSDHPISFATYLAGAVINNLFGSQAADNNVSNFAVANRASVEQELRRLATHCAPLLPLLTDALRMQTLCDNQEGIHSIPSLLMAKALGILQEERPLPLPSTFMLQVRSLASQHGLVTSSVPESSLK